MFINLDWIKANNHCAINDNNRSGHLPKFLRIGQSARILRDVPLLKLYSLLRKILFRLIAEHSPMLGVNDDVLGHFSPPAEFAPLASKR